MKLVERVLDNIPSEEISQIASEFGFSSQKMSSVINATISGALSAFKARIVPSINSGDMSPLLGLVNGTNENFNLNELFDSNSAALNTLYQRISEFSGVDSTQISQIIPTIMPVISNAITTMFHEYSANTITESAGNFISDLMSNNNGYETAISAANNFLGSVFGNLPDQTSHINNTQDTPKNDNFFVQNLFDLFDQDNDGSVMDDIYRMLVR
jgi:Bacterial protein of unknown function (DUF937)